MGPKRRHNAPEERKSAPSPRDPERLIPIATVMGTHGVRGELRVKMHNPDSDLLEHVDEVLVRTREGQRLMGLDSVRPGSKGLLVQLEGLESVEQARALHGAELCVPRAALPALPDGEYYHVDLEGLSALTQDGTRVGEVKDVFEYPASSVLRVVTAEGLLEVPMIEPYLVRVDLAQGQVILDELDDLTVEKPRSPSRAPRRGR